jgi:Cu+-exporting ATPase
VSPVEHVFEVTGMHCPSCGVLIDDAVEQVPGVLAVRTDVATGRTTVQVDGPDVPVPALLEAITAEGYGARPVR